jgi:cyclase
MKNTIAFFFVFLFLIVLLLPGDELKSQGNDLQVQKISENLFTIAGGGGNVAFLTTKDGVFVIDSKISPAFGEKIIAKIREITDKPIKYLVFTHYHADHIQGAQSFPSDAVIISHPNTRLNIESISIPRLSEQREKTLPGQINQIEQKTAEWYKSLNNSRKNNTTEPDPPTHAELFRQKKSSTELNYDSALSSSQNELSVLKNKLSDLKIINLQIPKVLVSNDTLIHFGGEDIRLFYLGSGHTNGDLIVYFVNQKVLHTGDLLFEKIIPYIDFEAGSDTRNWIDIMQKLYDMDIQKVIPGHGDLCDKKALLLQSEYLNDLRNEVQKCIDYNMPLEKIKVEARMGKYAEWDGYIQRISRNIEAVYNEITKK